MSLLISLPEALLSAVYSTWLTIVDVARLDSAVCCFDGRPDFLNAAFKKEIVLQYQRGISIEDEICESVNLWILHRKASVPGIFATPAFMHCHERRQVYLKQHGDAIRWIEYACESGSAFWSDQVNSQRSAVDILQYCPKLVRFRANRFQGDLVLMALSKCCPFLEDVTNLGSGCSVDGMTALSRGCTKLRKLEIDSSAVIEEGLVSVVRNNPGLVTISACCGGSTHRLLHELAMSCSSLVELYLHRVGITEATMHLLLRQCQSLNSLTLSSCSAEEPIDEPEVEVTVAYSKLRALELQSVQINDDELNDLLRACLCLASLTLIGCSELERLQYCRLGQKCPSLQVLVLENNGSFLDDDALIDICSSCSDLCVLEIPRSVEVTDEGLISLVVCCPELETLDVSGCIEITDRFLDVLAKSGDSLTTLTMHNCPRITQEAVGEVRRLCPDLDDISADAGDARDDVYEWDEDSPTESD